VTNTGDAELAIAGQRLVGPDQAAFRLANDDCIGHHWQCSLRATSAWR